MNTENNYVLNVQTRLHKDKTCLHHLSVLQGKCSRSIWPVAVFTIVDV